MCSKTSPPLQQQQACPESKDLEPKTANSNEERQEQQQQEQGAFLPSHDPCSLSSQSSNATTRKSVRFHNVEIREYVIILGDNPSCSHGPPVSLGWNYDENQQQHFPLDTYEKYRDGQRRTQGEMKVPGHMRHTMLREWGVPNRDIMKVQLECEMIQRQRSRIFHSKDQRTTRNLGATTCVLRAKKKTTSQERGRIR